MFGPWSPNSTLTATMRRWDALACRPSDSSCRQAARGMDSRNGSPNDTPDARKKLRRDGIFLNVRKDIGIAYFKCQKFLNHAETCYQNLPASHWHKLDSKSVCNASATPMQPATITVAETTSLWTTRMDSDHENHNRFSFAELDKLPFHLNARSENPNRLPNP